MASSVSKILMPGAFIGPNDFESYLTYFELLAKQQNWKRTVRSHYFALRLQKSAIEFYQTLSEATRNSYAETVTAFQWQHSEKLVVFRRRQARRVQQSKEKLTNFLRNFLEAVIKMRKKNKPYGRIKAEIRKDLVNRLVQQMSVEENKARSSDGRKENGHWGATQRKSNQYREQGSRYRARTPNPGPNTREKKTTIAEWKTTKTRVTGQNDHLAKNCRNCFICVILPTFSKIALGLKGPNKPT